MSKQQIRRVGDWVIVQTGEGVTHMFQPQDVTRTLLASPYSLNIYLANEAAFQIRTDSQADSEEIMAAVIAATTTDDQVKAAAELARAE